MATWKKVAFEDDAILESYLATTGDLITASAASTPALVAIAGHDTHVLNVATDTPDWVDPSGFAVGAHTLNDHTAPDAAMDFDGQQAKDLQVQNEASPPSAAVGKWYFDTTGGDLHLYLCSAI